MAARKREIGGPTAPGGRGVVVRARGDRQRRLPADPWRFSCPDRSAPRKPKNSQALRTYGRSWRLRSSSEWVAVLTQVSLLRLALDQGL